MLAPRKTLWSTPPSALDAMEQWIDLQPNDCVCDIGCGDGRILLLWAERYTSRRRRRPREQQQQEQPPQVSQNDDEANMDMDDNNNDNDDDNTKNYPLTTMTVSFIGIDIDPDRIQQSQTALDEAKSKGTIDSDVVSIQFHCANALEAMDLFKSANIFFLYLIPRGLKLIKPILLDHKEAIATRKRLAKSNEDRGEIGSRSVSSSSSPSSSSCENSLPPLRIVTYMAKLPGESHVDRALCTVEHQPGAEWPLYFYHL
jgi:SAM-dependent methyltransferase